jgi:hypothetical protein
VDNWLREHPRDANPTARICARYASLLGYINQWRGEEGKGYDALIIFAHSQGTVITADLLRFLRTEQQSNPHFDSSLSKLFPEIPIYLFTVGCPLRQLYALRFPYLYGYAPVNEDEVNPNPKDLGVCQWINAYRSGDYVGRHLWRNDPWKPVTESLSLAAWNPPTGLPQNVWHQDNRFDFLSAQEHIRTTGMKPLWQSLKCLTS